MILLEKTEVVGFEPAIRGMKNVKIISNSIIVLD